MPFQPADHYEATGQGIRAILDTTSINGKPSASVTVDGRSISPLSIDQDAQGFHLVGNEFAIADGDGLNVEIVIPEINIDVNPITAPGFAVLTVTGNSIGGPRLVLGALQQFDIRPLVVSAQLVNSLASIS
jgi:hypothetical protein